MIDRLTQARLVVAIVGIAVWGWGVRTDDSPVRIVGIAIIAAAVLLRWIGRRQGRTPPDVS